MVVHIYNNYNNTYHIKYIVPFQIRLLILKIKNNHFKTINRPSSSLISSTPPPQNDSSKTVERGYKGAPHQLLGVVFL